MKSVPGFALQLGFSVVLPTLGFTLLGKWLDEKWGTAPWLVLAGLALALVFSLFLVYQIVKPLIK